MSTKEIIVNAMTHLPDDTSIDNAIERLMLLRKIEIGLRQVKNGETVSHEEFMQELDELDAADNVSH